MNNATRHGLIKLKICKYFSAEFQNWMVRQMNVVKAQLRQLQECVDALLNSCNLNGQGGGQSLNTLPAGLLPVDCDSDLKKLEDFATESRNTLVEYYVQHI